MLNQGIIRPLHSPWHSPMVIVPKGNGTLQLCINFRKFNEVAKFDVFPMPHIEELLEWIGQPRYISTINTAKGYWQIPVTGRDRPKTAFSTPWALFESTWMPFNLHGAAATFQWLMDHILAPHMMYAEAYIDDVVIYARTWEQHLHYVEAVLQEIH